MLAWDHAAPGAFSARPTTTTAELGMKSASVRSARLTGGGARQRPVRILPGGAGGRGTDGLDVALVGVSLAVS